MSSPSQEEFNEGLKDFIDDIKISEDAEGLSQSLSAFVKEAWPVLKPGIPYQHNWHIDAICDRLGSVSHGEITRLQIWVPPVVRAPRLLLDSLLLDRSFGAAVRDVDGHHEEQVVPGSLGPSLEVHAGRGALLREQQGWPPARDLTDC